MTPISRKPVAALLLACFLAGPALATAPTAAPSGPASHEAIAEFATDSYLRLFDIDDKNIGGKKKEADAVFIDRPSAQGYLDLLDRSGIAEALRFHSGSIANQVLDVPKVSRARGGYWKVEFTVSQTVSGMGPDLTSCLDVNAFVDGGTDAPGLRLHNTVSVAVHCPVD